jgi:hypothetical protein
MAPACFQTLADRSTTSSRSGNGLNGAPAFFGMNFQSVSVAQKLKKCMPGDQQQTGGYLNPQGVPRLCLQRAINWVDQQIGSMVQTLGAPGLKNTLVIISVKHGQSPIDYSKRVAYDDGAVIAAPINAGACGANFAADSADDGVLIWLKKETSGSTDWAYFTPAAAP